MALKKPSDFFQESDAIVEIPQTPQVVQEFVVSSSITETFEKFKDNIEKLDALNETVESFSEQLSNKVNKAELENAMMSQLMLLDENFKTFKKQIRGVNKKDLSEIYQAIEELVNYIEEELPKYKKSITSNELKVGTMFSNFKEELQEDVSNIKDELADKVSIIEENIIETNKQVQEAYDTIKETSDTYNKLFETVEHKVLNEERIIKDYSSLIENLQSEIEEFKNYIKEESNKSIDSLNSLIEEKVSSVEEDVNKKLNQLNNLKESLDEEITSIKTDVVVNEKHLKKIENYIQENHKELVEIREEVLSEIQKLSIGNLETDILKLQKKIDFIKETYSQINTEEVVKEVLKEGLLNEPPSTKNSDPLTPLDKNYVTLDQLQQHYKLFINRIQQQLSTLGGGGETRLEFLDDVDRTSAKVDGRFLKYDASSGKWVGATGGGGGGSQTLDQTLGLGNTSSLGMSVGISTFNNVIVGGATTDLLVNGNARITGNLNVGNLNSSGVITATTFVGNLSGIATNATYATSAGIATYATSAGIATALQNPRTFQITGDIVSTSVSFDGTGNVSLAATIQPNSVGLGTNTTGDYVQSISGTSNQITITNGTGEGSTPIVSIPNQFTTPQDATITRDLQVNRNLNVNGNITIGGTSATLFTTELKVADPDIVLGIRTDSNNNDVSTDNTANHGGVAIASTEGNPLVQLYIAGIETTPATYKKFMWFKQGTFTGLGTDAWLSNYAIGIGSTQFPSGTRLAVGNVQFNQNDLSVVRNINSSGIVTATTFVPSSGYIKAPDGTNSFYIYSGTGDVAFQGKINTSQINSASGYKALDFGTTTTPSVNITNSLNVGSGLSVVGVSTLGITTFTGRVSFGTSAFFGDNTNLNFGNSNNLQLYYNGANSIVGASGGLIVSGSSITYSSDAHSIQNAANTRTFANFAPSGTTFYINNNTKLQIVGTGITVTGTTFTNDLSVSGVTTSTGGFVGNLTGNASSATYATSAGIATYAGTAGIATYASTAGIATVSQGLTGTPNINVGIATATSYNGSGTNLTGIVTSIVAGNNITISGSTGQVTINSTASGSQWQTTSVGINTLSNVGIGTTNPTESLSVLGKIQIQQKPDSTSRLIFRGVPGTPYRWNIDNDASNLFRIFREDDATSANGVVAVSISTTGTLTATKFSGDGSLLTGIVASGSGVVVQNQGSTVGTAGTINFSTNLTASFASGTATVSLSNNPTISGILTADQVYTSNNGNGTNIRIGDDLWIGDINVANTTRFSGAQNSDRAFIVFGNSDAVALGRTGTGPLYYGGNFTSAGIVSATSYSGSGTNLTGIVTSIVAGNNITISGSSGQVTINSTASGGGTASIDILEAMLFV